MSGVSKRFERRKQSRSVALRVEVEREGAAALEPVKSYCDTCNEFAEVWEDGGAKAQCSKCWEYSPICIICGSLIDWDKWECVDGDLLEEHDPSPMHAGIPYKLTD